MKKIFLFLFSLPLLLSFSVQNSIAQNNQPLFDLSSPIRQEKIANNQETQAISLLPFTTLIIKPGTFKKEVTLNVYSENWDNIKAVLPEGQSPISSYYFIFKSNNETVSPSLPLSIQSYNNYINTNTFFYPVSSITEIDKVNQKEFPGNIRVSQDLPTSDAGFIVAANKLIAQDDPALLKTTPSPLVTDIQTQTNQENKNSFYSLLPVVAALAVVMAAISFVFFFMYKKAR